MSKRKTDEVTGVETTGHSWDGIEELNNPLPRWWLWTFYACIVWGIGYTIAYPAWPMVVGATEGVLHYSTRGEVARNIETFETANADLSLRLATASAEELAADEDLTRFAVASGGAVFRNNCSQCHGSGAAGAKGYPNLLDDDWLWGGTPDDITYTVRHGIRNELDPDARYSQMPAFGDMLARDEIAALVEEVRNLSGQEYDATLAQVGATLFADNCSACHGDAGTGNRDMGAPNLTDAIWLYGGDRDTLTETITNARFGVMPPWNKRLTDSQIRAVATYVHQLGGGEPPVPEEGTDDN